ncbi:MBL fold metallo-hydrolase [Thermanaerosceptrum fracticalcis]|nr:MBL fold metallo-hydrolase [Thermanaerosceptrum fracticalcis]
MVDNLIVQILADNKAGGKGLLAEHGLSLLVECDGEQLLFDTGQGLVLNHNAAKLNIDLAQIKKVALSHGHYDHTGGLLSLLKGGCHPVVYAHPDVFITRYVREKEVMRDCGLPFSQKELEEQGASFTFSRGPTELYPGVILSGEIPRLSPVEYPNFLVPGKEEWLKDSLADDQFILVLTKQGPVLILGCTHAGLANTLAYAQRLAGGQRIFAVLGGMHLAEAKPAVIENNINIIRESGIEYVIPLHCTGFHAMSRLYQVFDPKFKEGKVGMKISFSELLCS